MTAIDRAPNAATLSHGCSDACAFAGFFSPVDNAPVLNPGKAGSATLVRLGLAAFQGLANFASGYPESEQVVCDPTLEVDGIESTAARGERAELRPGHGPLPQRVQDEHGLGEHLPAARPRAERREEPAGVLRVQVVRFVV